MLLIKGQRGTAGVKPRLCFENALDNRGHLLSPTYEERLDDGDG